MKPMILFLLVAAVGNAIYHLAQKTLSQASNPMVLLMAVYALAFVFSAMAVPLFRGGSPAPVLSQVATWPVLALAAGVFIIEAGFLFAYRTGGALQWSGVAVNAVSALILLPIALVFFRESFSWARLGGIVMTLSGLALLARSRG